MFAFAPANLARKGVYGPGLTTKLPAVVVNPPVDWPEVYATERQPASERQARHLRAGPATQHARRAALAGPRLVGRRLLTAIPVLWGVTLLTFIVVEALPGSAAQQLLGPNATPEQVAAARGAAGDEPADGRPLRRLARRRGHRGPRLVALRPAVGDERHRRARSACHDGARAPGAVRVARVHRPGRAARGAQTRRRDGPRQHGREHDRAVGRQLRAGARARLRLRRAARGAARHRLRPDRRRASSTTCGRSCCRRSRSASRCSASTPDCCARTSSSRCRARTT